jgi:hypothetical protein
MVLSSNYSCFGSISVKTKMKKKYVRKIKNSPYEPSIVGSGTINPNNE